MKRTAILLICCLFILPGTVQATSIALIYESDDEDLAAVGELTQAALADRDDLTFLERQEINAVLTEQETAAGGLIEFETAARLNAILKADLLAIALPAETGNRYACDLVIFDTYRGIRFTDKMLSAQNMEDWISACRKELVSTAERYRHPGTSAKTFCIQRVQDIDLPPKASDQLYAYVDILERDLVQQGNICLLERSHLDSLRRENKLTLQEPSDLLATATYLDLEASRGTNGSITIIGQFRDSKGSVLHQFTLNGSFDDGSAFIDETIREVTRFLGTAIPAGNGDREAEAERFYRDSLHGSRLGALRACEAACLLSPQNPTYRARLGMLYIDAAQHNVKRWPGYEGVCRRDGSLPSHGFSFRPPRRDSWYAVGREELFRGLQQYQEGVDLLRTLPAEETADELKDLINTVDFDFESIADPSFPEDAQDIRRSIKQQLRNHWVDRRHENRVASITNALSFADYTEWLTTDLLTWLKPATVTSDDWYREAMANVQIWLKQAQPYGLDEIPSAMNDMGRFLLGPDLAYLRLERPSIGYLDKTKRPASPSDTLAWAPLYAELQTNSHPVLRFYGTAGELNLHPKETLTQKDYDRVWEAGLDLIKTLPQEASIERYQAYHAVLNALMLFPRREMIRRHRDLFEEMSTRHEFVFAVAWRASAYQSPWAKVSNEELASWTDRVLDYLRRDDLIFLPKPVDVPRIRNLFLAQKAKRTQLDSFDNNTLVPEQTRRISLDCSDWNGPATFLYDDANNGFAYFYSFGFLDPRSTSRPAIGFSRNKPLHAEHANFYTVDFSGRLIKTTPPIGDKRFEQSPPHLFMEFYKLHVAEAATEFLGEIAVDHISMLLARADADHLVEYRIPEGDMLDFDANTQTLSTNRLRDSPFMNNINELVQIGPMLFCREYQSTLYAYDLNKHSWQTILSPKRIKAQNPIEKSGSTFVIQHMFKRPGKNAVYCVIHFPSDPKNELAGIWHYNADSGFWSKAAADPGYRITISQPEEDGVWLYGDPHDTGEGFPTIFFWNYKTTHLKPIFRHHRAASETGQSATGKKKVPKPPYLRRGEQLWTANPFGFVDLSTGIFSPTFITGNQAPIAAFANGTNGLHVVRQLFSPQAAFEVLDISDEQINALLDQKRESREPVK